MRKQAFFRYALTLGVLLLAAGTANAQSFSKSGLAAGTSGPAVPPVLGPTSITQSTNASTVTTGASVSCNGGTPNFFHTDNSYFRAFTLSAFNPPLDQTQFMVQSVTFGIETANASGTGTTQPVTVRIHSSTTNPPTNASLTQLATETVNVPDQTLSLITVPITAQPVFTVATGILVVEIFTPNGQTAGHSFFIGANSLGQTGPSFIRAASCGISEITSTTTIGFPNMHIVMTVNGNSQVPVTLETFSVD